VQCSTMPLQWMHHSTLPPTSPAASLCPIALRLSQVHASFDALLLPCPLFSAGALGALQL
jgi:hypothetical protein